MIVLQFDAAYHHWGCLMIRSLALHEPAHNVLADTVNLSVQQRAELKQAHPRLLVTSETIPVSEALPAIMARRKTMVLHRAMETFPDEPWFAMFDADMVVRRPVPDLWALMDDHPAALFMTDGVWEGRAWEHSFTPSGVVLVRRDGRELVDNWLKWDRYPGVLYGHPPGEWMWDQCTLLKARDESTIRCAVIPFARFSCNRCSGNSAMWSGHGEGKGSNYRRFWVEHEVQRVLRRHPLLRSHVRRPARVVNHASQPQIAPGPASA
jgi:hypothetical protein